MDEKTQLTLILTNKRKEHMIKVSIDTFMEGEFGRQNKC